MVSALSALVQEEGSTDRGRLYRTVMARVELPLLRHVLQMSGGNRAKAARVLGINRNTLRKRLRVLGPPPPAAPSRNGSGTPSAAAV